MKEPYGEGGARHPGPESCGVAREGEAEALTGGSAGERVGQPWPAPVPTRRNARRWTLRCHLTGWF